MHRLHMLHLNRASYSCPTPIARAATTDLTFTAKLSRALPHAVGSSLPLRDGDTRLEQYADEMTVVGHALFPQYSSKNDANPFRFSCRFSDRQIASSAVRAHRAADEVPHRVNLANKCASALVVTFIFFVEHPYLSLRSTDEVIDVPNEARTIRIGHITVGVVRPSSRRTSRRRTSPLAFGASSLVLMPRQELP